MSIAERRRAEIAQAAISIISRDGFDALSLRAITAEMGCSTGVLTHHFRDKAALVDFVLDTLIADIEATAHHRSGADRSLETLLLHLLPHDVDSTARWQALIAFSAASMSEPSLQPGNARRELAIRTPLIERLQRHRPADRDPSIDFEIEADLLLSMVDGLALRILFDRRRFTKGRILALIRRYLNASGFGGREG